MFEHMFATIPAIIAMIEFNYIAKLNVFLKFLSSNPLEKCSLIIQLSKTEKSKDVLSPPKIRPTTSILKSLKCLVQHDNEYVIQ